MAVLVNLAPILTKIVYLAVMDLIYQIFQLGVAKSAQWDSIYQLKIQLAYDAQNHAYLVNYRRILLLMPSKSIVMHACSDTISMIMNVKPVLQDAQTVLLMVIIVLLALRDFS